MRVLTRCAEALGSVEDRFFHKSEPFIAQIAAKLGEIPTAPPTPLYRDEFQPEK
jgi:hypothetical protein